MAVSAVRQKVADGGSELPAPRPPIVAKFGLADAMSQERMWLLKRLTHKWPHISEATYTGRVRAWINSNTHCFVKTAHTIALFRLTNEELDPKPHGEEVFLFSTEPRITDSASFKEARMVYRYAANWARQLGCSRLIISKVSDHGNSDMVRQLEAAEDLEISIVL